MQLVNSQVTTLPIYQHQLSALTVKLKNITIDRLNSAGFYIHKDQIVNRTYMPKLSVGIDVFPNSAIQRLVLRGELLIAPTKSEVITLYKYNDHTDNQTADINLNIILRSGIVLNKRIHFSVAYLVRLSY